MPDTLQVDPIVDTTTNVLTDFDIAASLSLKSINVQLADAWKKWHHKTNGVNEFTITREDDDEGGDPDKTVCFEAKLTLSVPSLSVNSAPSGLHGVVVTFQIVSGTMKKYVGTRVATLDMSGRSFSFLASLVQNEVTQEQLYKVDAQTAKTVAALSSGSAAGAFTIECLFLNLTNINVVTGFEMTSLSANEVERRFKYTGFPDKWVAKAENLKNLRTSLEDTFVLFMRDRFKANPENGSGAKFLLNTTLRPHAPKVEPSLLINGIRFKVTRPAGNSAGFPASIDYLGTVVNGKTMPALGGPLDNALSAMGSWLTPSRVDGAQAMAAGMMAVRGARFAALIADYFSTALPEQFKRMEKANNEKIASLGKISNPGKELPYPEFKLLSTEKVACDEAGVITIRSSDTANEYKWTGEEAENKVYFVLKKTLAVILKPVRHKCYEVDGTYKIDLQRKRDTFWGHTDAHAITEAKIKGTLLMKANSDGVVCEITPEVAITIEKPVQVTSHSASKLAVIFNKDKWDGERAVEFSNDISAAIKTMLEEVFSQLNLRLKDFAIIPPGGEAFGFSKPRIGNHGDLFLDLVYRSSLKPK